MLTDHKLEEFLFISEGGNRSPAYDDFQPWKTLEPGDEIKGTLTIGPGFTTRSDGSPVQIGDTMTDQEAYDRLRRYIAEEVEPVLEDLIHVPIATSLANALGSLIYNFGATEVYGWRLWGRINSGEPAINIVNEWIDGTFSSKGVPMLGLWRRRFKELALAFGLEWRAGENVSWEHQPDEFLEVLGWDGAMPKPEPIIDSDLFNEDPELQIPHRGANEVTREKGSDPTPETPMTLDDAQFLNAEAVGYDGTYADFMAHRTVVTQRNAIEAPKVDAKKPPKPMEDSKTHRGLSKKDSGKEGVQMGAVLTGAATTMGTMRELTRDTAATAESASPLIGGFTANHLILVGLFIGVPLLIWGAWRMMRGEMIAREGRQEGTQLKV
jgi:GH24 family phage-related lysozyme (muramidase)